MCIHGIIVMCHLLMKRGDCLSKSLSKIKESIEISQSTESFPPLPSATPLKKVEFKKTVIPAQDSNPEIIIIESTPFIQPKTFIAPKKK